MNMMYLDEFAESEAANSGYEETALNGLLQNSKVRNFLKPYGYEMVAFETGYLTTHVTSADHYLQPDMDLDSKRIVQPFNRFESMLIDTTLYRLFHDTLTDRAVLKEQIIYPEYEAHRTRIVFTINSLADFADRDGNYFIFAHVIAPHPPFVFDGEGNPILATIPFSMEDGNKYHGDIEDYRALYPQQLTYINKLILKTIDAILDKSTVQPIIIIQADHGSGVSMVWDDAQLDAIQERFSILNAYYFPDQDYSQLYPAISPVNSFRQVFNQFFNADYEILDDRSYFFNHPDFLTRFEVTDLLK
jgi:hypothetical protein